MEALVALNLACNVLTVLDFAYDVLNGSLYLVQSGEEVLPGNKTSSAIAADLRVLTSRIQCHSSSSSVDPRLRDLCSGCDKLSRELISLLGSLSVVRRRQLLAKAIKAQFDKSKIVALENRLDRYRSEIHLYVTTDLRYGRASLAEEYSHFLVHESIYTLHSSWMLSRDLARGPRTAFRLYSTLSVTALRESQIELRARLILLKYYIMSLLKERLLRQSRRVNNSQLKALTAASRSFRPYKVTSTSPHKIWPCVSMTVPLRSQVPM